MAEKIAEPDNNRQNIVAEKIAEPDNNRQNAVAENPGCDPHYSKKRARKLFLVVLRGIEPRFKD